MTVRKYRVWDPDFGMFRVGSIDYINSKVSYFVDWNNILDQQVDECDFGWKEANVKENSNIMEYTGLTDINNVEICVNDILEMKLGLDGRRKVLVKFDSGAFYITKTYPTLSYALLVNNLKDYPKIIGNIYENPELLGGGVI